MIKIKLDVLKCIAKYSNKQILGCVPNSTDDFDKVEMNKYGNFTLIDETLSLSENHTYEVEMDELNGKWGKQYKVISIPTFNIDISKGIDAEMEMTILTNITSDGLAKTIHEAYPNYAKLILEGKQDEINLDLIKGVKDYRHSLYCRLINEKFKYYYVMNEFKSYNLNLTDCKLLCDEYSTIENVSEKMNENPYYCLNIICGWGFFKTDKNIMDNRPDLKDSALRTEFALLYYLHKNELEGNTYNEANIIGKKMISDGIPATLIRQLKDVATESELIYYDEVENTLAIANTYVAECTIASFIKEKLKHDNKLDIDYKKYIKNEDFVLTEEQSKILENLCNYEINILLGYAGTGKSSTMKGLINLLEDNNLSYTLLAPTGRASSKLSESTNRPSSTIHKACMNIKGLNTDVIIIDEFSFLGTELMTMLISNILNDNARLVFVGDNKQLAPISHGKVFNDLIESGVVPTAKLTKVFRYGEGGIAKVATDIRNGENFLSGEPVQKIGKDYVFIESDEPSKTVVEEYMKLIDKGIKPNKIMGLSPYNVGDEGCMKLNSEIQKIVNPPKKNQMTHTVNIKRKGKEYKINFRVGDYVINTKNDYSAITSETYDLIKNNKELTENDVEQVNIYNGDCGQIVKCEKDVLYIQFDNNIIVYNKLKMYNLLLSYFLNVYKAQGSQMPYVLNITSPLHKRMHSRNMLYVASTRASKQHIEIGSSNCINECLQKEENDKRLTKLIGLLQK